MHILRLAHWNRLGTEPAWYEIILASSMLPIDFVLLILVRQCNYFWTRMMTDRIISLTLWHLCTQDIRAPDEIVHGVVEQDEGYESQQGLDQGEGRSIRNLPCQVWTGDD
jgi:hypothetical protein